MIVVGLTGGIGSGKSSVSALLAAKGAVVVDADAITHDLQRPGAPVFAAMVERFGPGVVAPDGSLDRAAVADIAFNDAEALADLNAIVHPAVGAEIAQRMAALQGSDAVVILDVPLMVESMAEQQRGRRLDHGAEQAGRPSADADTGRRVGVGPEGRAGESKRGYPLDGMIVVDVDPEVAVQRLVEQRGMREADARARIARQASRDERLARADRVVHNGGSRDELRAQVDEVWAWMEKLRASSHNP